MNNSELKDGEGGLKMYVIDTPAPSLISARSASPKEPTNPFGMAFRDCFDKSAMAQQDFAEVLSLELKRPVSQVNVSNWLRGVEPRSSLARPNLAADVLAAANRIADNEFTAGREKYADPQKVSAQFTEWESAGLTPRQIQLAAEISVTLYRVWHAGKTRISAARWEVAHAKVNMWKDFVTENQKNWQAQAGQAKAKSTRTPTRGTKARKG